MKKEHQPHAIPERNLANLAHRPITVSLGIAAQAARIYQDERPRRAILWLANLAANSQRIQLCWQMRGLTDPLGTIGRITEAHLSQKLGLTPKEIYQSLTGADDAPLDRFTKAVEDFRADFERQLPPVVETEDSHTIQEAFDVAVYQHKITTILGKWRHGKTEELQRLWLLNLDRVIWVPTPEDTADLSLHTELGNAQGISTHGKKVHRLREQNAMALGIGLIEGIIWEEAHNLLPADLANSKPRRIEYSRGLNDSRGIGQIYNTTEQFALQVEVAKKENALWAPGQFTGRRYTYKLRDIHNDKEIAAIARLHGGGFLTEDLIAPLVAYAKKEEGYLGSMVNVISASKRAAQRARRNICLASDLAGIMKAQATDERIQQLASSTKAPSQRRKFRVIEGRRAA